MYCPLLFIGIKCLLDNRCSPCSCIPIYITPKKYVSRYVSHLGASMEPLSAKVASITKQLGLPESLPFVQTIEQANEQLGLQHAAGTSLVQQANVILAELGLNPEVRVVAGLAVDADAKAAKPAVRAAAAAADSPPELSSGSGAPPPTKGPVPAVPMRYKAYTDKALTKNHQFTYGLNIAFVVLALLAVWFGIIIEHDVLTGSLLPTPSPPPPPAPAAPPQAPTTCPFDVVACNRQCALMHVECEEWNLNHAGTKVKRNKKWVTLQPRNCDRLHGGEIHNQSAANNAVNKTYFESLDWVNETSLWGLRKEQIGDGRCDRSGCGATLCKCNFDGGDCVEETSYEGPDQRIAIYVSLWGAFCMYLFMMTGLLSNVVGYHLKAPKLRDERELTAYVTEMQRAQLQVSFSVVCSHSVRAKNREAKSSTHVTHRSSHPFAYAASTDVSTLTKNWQQPAGGGGGEDGSLGTGFVAVVSSDLSWKPAKGVTADKFKAEKQRLYEENKHRDRNCSVTAVASLPGRRSNQLYAPANATNGKRLPCIAEALLVLLGLGAPLWSHYRRALSRHIKHTVVKTIYIEGHAAPAQRGGGGAVC